MSSRHRLAALTACLLVATGAALPTLTGPHAGAATVARTATLSVTPGRYYAGQGLLVSGSLPRAGVRTVWLEQNMGRPGDVWMQVPGSSHRTDAAGHFSFRHPAPGMNNIHLRVASGIGATPGHVMNAVDDATVVSVRPASGSWPASVDRSRYTEYVSYPAITGRRITITVDTSPADGPVLVGRPVALQRRVTPSTWRTVASGEVGSNGKVSFTRPAGAPGVVTYRARTADWTRSGGDIGWQSSWPTALYVLDADGHGTQPAVPSSYSFTPAPHGPTSGEGAWAGQRYGWGAALFDFAFEWGESLGDGPFRGTRLRGHWAETSDGSGKAGRHNGGLFLESRYGVVNPTDHGPGDHGTTTATLRDNAQTYGRWEVKLRAWDIAEAGPGYRVRAELVPDAPSQRACGARAITLADFTPEARSVRFGARTPVDHRQWTRTRSGIVMDNAFHTFAAEVTAAHVTWFLDGRPVGTAPRAAVPGVPLTVRLSLVGRGQREMQHTYAGADWVRAWGLGGHAPVAGTAMRAGTHTLGC